MKQRRIDLHIEEIILCGVGSGDAEQIKVSAAQELTRLFAEQGMSERLAAKAPIARIEGGQIGIAPGATSAPTGKQIARAIYGTIKR